MKKVRSFSVVLLLGLMFASLAHAGEGGGADSGRGTLGKDLLDYREVTDARIVRLNNEVIKRVSGLNLEQLPELAHLRNELNAPILEMTKNAYKDGNQYPGDWRYGGMLFGYTDLKSGAPTFIYPIAYSARSDKRLSDVQIKQLLVHEALHRALPEPVNGHEAFVVSVTRFLLFYSADQVVPSIKDAFEDAKFHKETIFVNLPDTVVAPAHVITAQDEPTMIQSNGWQEVIDLLAGSEQDLNDFERIKFVRQGEAPPHANLRFAVTKIDLSRLVLTTTSYGPRSALRVEQRQFKYQNAGGYEDAYFTALEHPEQMWTKCQLHLESTGQGEILTWQGETSLELTDLLTSEKTVLRKFNPPFTEDNSPAPQTSLETSVEISDEFQCADGFDLHGQHEVKYWTRRSKFNQVAHPRMASYWHLDNLEQLVERQHSDVKFMSERIAGLVQTMISGLDSARPQQ